MKFVHLEIERRKFTLKFFVLKAIFQFFCLDTKLAQMKTNDFKEEIKSATSKYFHAEIENGSARPLKRMKVVSSFHTSIGNNDASNLQRLTSDFYDQECELLAKILLGKILVRQFNDGSRVWGRIVETEAYLGGEDKASHSYGNKRTQRNAAMFMEPGTVYVYSIYGMYFCFNVSSKGEGAAVLIRAIEPLGGLELMEKLRRSTNKAPKKLTAHQLCNGPSKLCISFGIDRQLNAANLVSSQFLWIEDENLEEPINIVISSRIGMSKKSEEWASARLRYYVLGSPSVSLTDVNQEKEARLKPC